MAKCRAFTQESHDPEFERYRRREAEERAGVACLNTEAVAVKEWLLLGGGDGKGKKKPPGFLHGALPFLEARGPRDEWTG